MRTAVTDSREHKNDRKLTKSTWVIQTMAETKPGSQQLVQGARDGCRGGWGCIPPTDMKIYVLYMVVFYDACHFAHANITFH